MSYSNTDLFYEPKRKTSARSRGGGGWLVILVPYKTFDREVIRAFTPFVKEGVISGKIRFCKDGMLVDNKFAEETGVIEIIALIDNYGIDLHKYSRFLKQNKLLLV